MSSTSSPSSSPAPRGVLVVGATGGIGRALCARLAARRVSLFLAARTGADLESLASELGSSVVGCRAVDATSTEQVEDLFGDAREALPSLDGVAHLAGSILLKPAHLTSDADWDATLAVNLGFAFRVLRASAKAMLRTGGSLVFVSTAAARTGLANHEAIAAAKGGLESLVRSAAATYAGRGLRINAVAPGLVDTPLAARITGNEKALETSRSMHPLGRIGRADDVASALDWLLDPGQSWVTGQVVGVDGGLADLKVG